MLQPYREHWVFLGQECYLSFHLCIRNGAHGRLWMWTTHDFLCTGFSPRDLSVGNKQELTSFPSPRKSKTTRVLCRLSYQIPVFVCMSVYISVCLIHHMVSVVNFWAHSSELVEEGEGGFREEELWLGQVFPLGKLGKKILKLSTAFSEGLAVS